MLIIFVRDKSGHGQEIWIEEKPSKVQKIFQISVTALSFLAFGGYLLCMIVQAIKSKGNCGHSSEKHEHWLRQIKEKVSVPISLGTTYYYPALMPMTSAMQSTTSVYKKRRPYRPKRSTKSKSDTGPGPTPTELYNILVKAAEGYVKLNENLNF